MADPDLKAAAENAALMAFRCGYGAGARDPSAILAAIAELKQKVDADVLSGWAKANLMSAPDFILQRTAAGKPVADLEYVGVIAGIAISQPAYTSLWL